MRRERVDQGAHPNTERKDRVLGADPARPRRAGRWEVKSNIGIMCMGCNSRLIEPWDTSREESSIAEQRLTVRARSEGWVELPQRDGRPHPVDMCGTCVREIAAALGGR